MKHTEQTDQCKQKKVNVFLYERWSSEAQGEGDSDRRQSQLAENWCARRGLRLTGLEKDDGVSAWKGKNRNEGSGLSRLLKLVRPGDYLLVEDNDRLSRQDWLTAMNFLNEIVEKGVTIVTLSNGNEIDAERFRKDAGCFLPALLRAHLGHDENEKKSERIQAAWEARKLAMQKGEAVRMHVPCWLSFDRKGKPVLVESNARVIRLMFEWAAEGLGCQTIARKLHREGHKLVVEGKRRERELAIGTSYVWRTLRNKMAIGVNTYVTPSQPHVFPAVIDDQTFYAVQAKIEGNRHRTAPRAHNQANLFTGLARCSQCGGTLCKFTQCRGGRSYRYLVCSDTLHKHGRCGLASFRYDLFEQSFGALLAQSGLMQKLLEGEKKTSRVDELVGKIASVDREIGKIVGMIRGDKTPARSLANLLKELEAERDQLTEALEVERAAALASPTPDLAYDELKVIFAELDGTGRQRAKALIGDLVEKIVVRLGEDRYEVHFRGCAMPVDVTVIKRPLGWMFSPSPGWVVSGSA